MDVEGFEEWYRACRPRAVAWLWAATGDRGLAEECVDEAFARALARWSRVRAMEFPRRWVETVALNQLRRTMRRRSVEDRLLRRRVDRPVDDGALPDAELWSAVRGLPERQRTAVALRYVADMTEDDVAGVMGIARGTVASTLSDARRSLAKTLEIETTTEPDHA
jgi:RNA polymerase sigma-70 factor (ECF subfamily)